MSCSDQIKIRIVGPVQVPDPKYSDGHIHGNYHHVVARSRSPQDASAGASAALRSSFRRCRHWRMTGCLGVPADPWPDPVQRGRRRIGAQHDDQPPARWHRDHGPRAITKGAGPPAPLGDLDSARGLAADRPRRCTSHRRAVPQPAYRAISDRRRLRADGAAKHGGLRFALNQRLPTRRVGEARA